jgi:hypothetical protein
VSRFLKIGGEHFPQSSKLYFKKMNKFPMISIVLLLLLSSNPIVALAVLTSPKTIHMVHVGAEDASLYPRTEIFITEGCPERSKRVSIVVPVAAFQQTCKLLATVPIDTQPILNRFGVFDVVTSGCPLILNKRVGAESFLQIMAQLHQPNAAGKHFPQVAQTIETMVRNSNKY